MQKVKRLIRDHLSPAEMAIYLECARTLKASQRINQRNYTLLLLMYQHALRVSEAIELQWQDVDFRNSSIIIDRKKGSMVTTQFMSKKLMKNLHKLELNKYSTKYIFAKPNGDILTRHSVNQLCMAINKKLGLDKNITPHSFKHSAGVNLAKSGKTLREVQHHLGHMCANNTLIYMQYAPGTSGEDLEV